MGEGAGAAAAVHGRGTGVLLPCADSWGGWQWGTKGLSSLVQTAVSQWSSVVTVMRHTEAGHCRGREKIQSYI